MIEPVKTSVDTGNLIIEVYTYSGIVHGIEGARDRYERNSWAYTDIQEAEGRLREEEYEDTRQWIEQDLKITEEDSRKIIQLIREASAPSLRDKKYLEVYIYFLRNNFLRASDKPVCLINVYTNIPELN